MLICHIISLELSFTVEYMQGNVKHWEARRAGHVDKESHRPSETPSQDSTLVNPEVYG